MKRNENFPAWDVKVQWNISVLLLRIQHCHILKDGFFCSDYKSQASHVQSCQTQSIYMYMKNETEFLTSCRCPTSWRSVIVGGALISFWLINRSREPEESKSPFQAIAPTLAVCPCNVVNNLFAWASQTWTSPACVPTAT